MMPQLPERESVKNIKSDIPTGLSINFQTLENLTTFP